MAAHDLEVGGIYYNVVNPGELSVTSGERAYIGSVAIPSTVEANGNKYTVTAIGDAAFYGCTELYALTVPATVKEIGSEAFVRCSYLMRFTVDPANTAYCAPDGVLLDKGMKHLVAFPAGSSTTYSIPEGIETVDKWAFAHCKRLSEVSFPASLRSIADAAFYGCTSLNNFKLPKQLASIGVWAFSECSNLGEVTLPASVTNVGDGAFSFCSSLKNIFVANGNSYFTSVDGVLTDSQHRVLVAFPGGRGGDYHLPSSIDSVKTQAFYGAEHLQTVTLPASLSSVKESPFVFCSNLKEILVDQNNSQYTSRDGVLFNKDCTQLVFFPNGKSGNYSVPDGVRVLSHGPFLCSTAVTGIDIPTSVTAIGNWTFLGCTGLSAVNIPYSVTSVGEQAFSDCQSLQTIICNGEPPAASAFDVTTQQGTMLYVPLGRKSEYKGADGWGSISSIEEFGLFAESQSIERGQVYRVPVCVTRTMPVTSAMMEVTLPEGIDMVADSGGKPLVEISQANANTHTVSCVEKEKGTFLLTVSPSNDNAVATSDTLLYMALKASTNMPTGVYDISLKNLSFTYDRGANRGEALQANAIAGLNIKLFVGDVNRNGRLNVADVVESVRYINGIANDTFHFEEADINTNGEVNNADAALIVERIHDMAGRSPLIVNDIWQAGLSPSSDNLTATPVSAEEGSDFMLNINLETQHGDLTAYQFIMPLSKGFSPRADDMGAVRPQLPPQYANSGCSVSATIIPNINKTTSSQGEESGMGLSVVCTSSSLAPLTNGLLLSLPMTTERFTPLADYEIPLQQIIFADVYANEYYLADSKANVKITAAAGISDVSISSHNVAAPPIYDIGGRKVHNQQNAGRKLNKGVYIIEGKKVVIR